MRYVILTMTLTSFFLPFFGLFLMLMTDFGWDDKFIWIGGAIVIISIAWTTQGRKLHSWLYSRLFSRITDRLDPQSWIMIEMEQLGTEHKLHLVPDDVGILYKENGLLKIVSDGGADWEGRISELKFQKATDSTLTCCIRILDAHNDEPIFEYVFEPVCSAPSRFEWFEQWVQQEPDTSEFD